MIFRISAALLAATSLAGAASAQSTIVVGDSAAASCYQHAVNQRSDRMALSACDTALDSMTTRRSDRPKTFVNRAVIYLHMGRAEMALSDLEAAARLDFDAPELYLNYSAAYIRLSRFNEAVTAATRAINGEYHALHQAYYNRAVAYENLGNVAAAYRDLQTASELAPDWPLPQRELERYQIRPAS
ncbi:tetratricopeptide repeat protein [Hyphobacterium marinum]|uniref:Tetratricopeptide repeat protein n=1 Tax=Hyphobacterium marinum TaxID=3116574 RepID=A0ABU7LWV5_9PROT|nr:tetratricopeptide repeat protein [Hyphobacterium sp. Y6023]MEE2566004.1 tetratricopeptide repeat protein [Hyphobacterium sp. Y6023]